MDFFLEEDENKMHKLSEHWAHKSKIKSRLEKLKSSVDSKINRNGRNKIWNDYKNACV